MVYPWLIHFPMLFQCDIDKFNEQFADLKWMESKLGSKPINLAAGREAERQSRKKELVVFNEFAPLDGVEGEMIYST